MSALRISAVTVTPVAFADPPLLNSVGVHEPFALRAVVEVSTDGGLSGLGETYADERHLAALYAAADAIVGADAYHTEQIYRRVQAIAAPDTPIASGLIGDSSATDRVFSPFEVACLDIQGQAAGRPVADLLGGAVRDEVPFSAYLFYKWAAHPGAEPDGWGEALDPDGIVAQARRMVGQYGFTALKLKAHAASDGGDRPRGSDPAPADSRRWAAGRGGRLRARDWRVDVVVEAPPSLGSRLRQQAARRPGQYHSSVDRRLRELAPDAAFVQFEHPLNAYYWNAIGGTRSILSTHNVDSQVLLGSVRDARALHRARLTNRALAMRSAERRGARHADAVLAVSEHDRSYFSRFSDHVLIAANGVDARVLRSSGRGARQPRHPVLCQLRLPTECGRDRAVSR